MKRAKMGPRQIHGPALRLGDLAMPLDQAIQRTVDSTRALAGLHRKGSARRRELEAKTRMYELAQQEAYRLRVLAEDAAQKRSEGGRRAAVAKKGNKARWAAKRKKLRKEANKLWDEKSSRTVPNVAALLVSRGVAGYTNVRVAADIIRDLKPRPKKST